MNKKINQKEIDSLETEKADMKAKLKLSGPILDWWNEADVQRDLKKIKFKIIGDFGGVMTVFGEEKELDKIKKLFSIDE